MARRGRSRRVGKRMAGPNHAVVSVVGGGFLYRREVCAECPWRLDSPRGEFPADAYRHSAPCAYDQAMTTFACHMSEEGKPLVCAGFLLQNALHNIGVRLAAMRGDFDHRKLRRTEPLFRNYRAMAEANGVPPSDPVLAPCRSSYQEEEE